MISPNTGNSDDFVNDVGNDAVSEPMEGIEPVSNSPFDSVGRVDPDPERPQSSTATTSSIDKEVITAVTTTPSKLVANHPIIEDSGSFHDDSFLQEVRSGSRQSKIIIYSSCLMVLMMLLDSVFSMFHYSQQVFSDRNDRIEMYDNLRMEGGNEDSMIPSYPDGGICFMSSSITRNSSSGSSMIDMMSHSVNMGNMLWEELLLFQVGLIQNVMHAALLLAAILIVWYRGNVIWMYFVRNVALFAMVTGFLFVFSDIYRATHANEYQYGLSAYRIIRIILVSCFTITGAITYYYYECIAWKLRGMVTMSLPSETPANNNAGTATTNPSTDPTKTNDDEVEESPANENEVDPDQAESSSKQIRHSNVIHYFAILSQIVIILFLIMTTRQWFKLNKICEEFTLSHQDTSSVKSATSNTSNSHHRYLQVTLSNIITSRSLEGVDNSSTEEKLYHQPVGDLHAYRMAFTMLAHHAFLLAMIQVSTIYPKDSTSLLLTMVASLGRIIIAICDLAYINENASHYDNLETRVKNSLSYTILELISMIPVLLASTSLFLHVRKLTPRIIYNMIQGKLYSAVVDDGDDHDNSTRDTETDHNNNNERDIEGANDNRSVNLNIGSSTSSDGVMKMAPSPTTIATTRVQKFSYPTLYEISYQSNFEYTYHQKIGAQLFYVGSVILFLEMTIENVLLLQQNFIGTNVTYDIYKWGMHITVIYVFCSFMCTETPFIYHNTRPILLFASPFGSLFGLWQLCVLAYNDDGPPTVIRMNHFIAVLFSCRFVCGVMQTLGLYVLKHIDPLAIRKESASALASMEQKLDVDKLNIIQKTSDKLEKSWLHARNALWMGYIPSCMLYLIYVTVIGNCSEPMITPLIPVDDIRHDIEGTCMVANADLLLAPNWPGMGLFFHFCLTSPIFAMVGIQRQIPVYKPALLCAVYFTGHVFFLLFCDIFIWDMMYQTDYWSSLEAVDITRRILLILWMVCSGYLSYCLFRLWKLRCGPK